MAEPLYYPCIRDWEAGHNFKRVGDVMPWADAVTFLKQNHSGAWQNATACPQPVTHEFFAADRGASEAN